MKNFNLSIFLSLIFFAFSFRTLTAQTFNLQNIPDEKKQIGLRFDKPFYSEDLFSTAALSGVYELNLNIPVSKKLNIIAAVPYIYTDYEVDYLLGTAEYKEDGIGNIFIGLQTRPESPGDSRTTISFGLTLPTADEQAAFSGSMVNYYYLQKYLPNNLGFYFNYAFHKIPEQGFHYGFEGGPNFLVATKEGRTSELFFHYGANAGYQIEKFLINAELLGIMIVSEDVDKFGDRFVHLLDFGFHWRGDVISPKIFYEIYLKDEINDYIKGILGIGLTLSID
jgi:hypothetical protein